MHLAVVHVLQREAGLHEPFQDLRLAGFTPKREELMQSDWDGNGKAVTPKFPVSFTAFDKF